MRKLLLAATALLALSAAPANAVLTVSFFDVGTATTASCSDGSACDNGGQVNQVLQINQIVGNFQIVGTFAASNSGSLQSSNLAIFNNGAATDTLRILVSQNGFSVPVTGINMSGSITFNDNFGAGQSTMSFYADPNNIVDTFATLNAPLFTVSKTPASSADAQSGTASVPFGAAGPFTLSEFASLNVLAGADITGFSQTMNTVNSAVPEPSTWALMILGFCGIVFMGARKRRQDGSFRFV